jgi:hypothetical protein
VGVHDRGSGLGLKKTTTGRQPRVPDGKRVAGGPANVAGDPALVPWLCVTAFRRLCSEQRLILGAARSDPFPGIEPRPHERAPVRTWKCPLAWARVRPFRGGPRPPAGAEFSQVYRRGRAAATPPLPPLSPRSPPGNAPRTAGSRHGSRFRALQRNNEIVARQRLTRGAGRRRGGRGECLPPRVVRKRPAPHGLRQRSSRSVVYTFESWS